MKKIVIVGVLTVVFICLFYFFRSPKPMDEETFRNSVLSAARQKMEADCTPDLLFDDFPASAWLFAQKYGYKSNPDILLGYDIVLETAEGSAKGKFKVRTKNKVYDMPLPDRLSSKVYYSFYSMCPLEVKLMYDGRGRDIASWVKELGSIPVAGGSSDASELYGAEDNVRVRYRMKGNKVVEAEVLFTSGIKMKNIAPEILERSLKPKKAGEWVLRSQWCVPNPWVERRTDLEEFTRLELKDFSCSLSVPILKGEIMLWNGYFVEGVLYFTYDGWKKASVISKWFDVPEVEFSEKRDGDVVEVRISDKLLKDIFLYLQRLMNSNSYDTLRKTILERSKK